jgi:heavy metal translocating P-type ATPase
MAPLALERIDKDSLRIVGLSPRSNAQRELVSWLRSRKEVVNVAQRGSGALEVEYRENGVLDGAFPRTLEDHLFAQRTRPPPFGVEIAHEVPGRVRLRASGGSEEDVVRLAEWLSTQGGILRASASPAARTVVVVFDEGAITSASLLELVRKSEPTSWPAASAPAPSGHWTTAALSTASLAVSAMGLLPLPVSAAGVALASIPSLRRALKALQEKRASVDLLDLAAIGISLARGDPFTAAFITWLLSLGDLLQQTTADRARKEITKLVKLDSHEAFRVEAHGAGERTVKIDPRRIRAGDKLAVAMGRRIPADGVVIGGHALVDEKALTGESEPRERKPGDRVLAATVVVEGEILVLVDRAGTDTTAAKIVKILEGAGAKPMTLQRDVEKVTDRLVLPTFGVAGAAMALSGQIDRMTSVLITDFGTGVRIALPTSALAGVTRAARYGVLIKGAQYLERLARTDVVVFDKTGTLTEGHPRIGSVHTLNGRSANEVLALAAAIEAQAAHPLAKAVLLKAQEAGVVIPEAEVGTSHAVVGRGMSARVGGRVVHIGSLRWMREQDLDLAPAEAELRRYADSHTSTLLVAEDRRLVGILGYADQPRAESPGIVRALQRGGRRRVVLLSGDAAPAVERAAKALGVDEAVGELLPEEKAEHVRRLQRGGKVVAMIGDGINDAPALALADVGISLHGGTDVALETADVVLLEGGLKRLPFAFEVGEQALRNVKRGLGLVIAPNAVAIALGAVGLLTPGMAALVNNGSTVLAALAAMGPLLSGEPDEGGSR